MKKIVVDASIAVKWFIPEIHSSVAENLLDPAIVLYAPDLIASEFGNILWKKVRRGELNRDEAGEMLKAFAAIPIEIHPSTALVAAALDLALELDRSVYDSLYLALAIAEDCVLVTADAKFHSVVAGSALAGHVHWVEDAIA